MQVMFLQCITYIIASLQEHEYAIFIGRLKKKTTKESIRSYFSRFGEVADVRLAWDAINKCTKTYGVVAFTDSDALEAVLSETAHQVLPIRFTWFCILSDFNTAYQVMFV